MDAVAPDIDSAVLREAAQWLVRLNDGEVGPADHAALQNWLDSSPQHARAWRRAESLLITGAGVSAGLDLGLMLVGLLRDKAYAETVQLLAEYAPEPPFNAGSPRTAPAAVTTQTAAMFVGFNAAARATLSR